MAGCLLTAAAVVVATNGVPAGPSAVTATGSRTVEVTLSGMRVRPAVIEAPAGTVLTLRVTNADAQRHDLRLASGERTPMLSSGQSATLTLPPLGESVDGWCTVAGHRAAGMTMRIVPAGGHDGHGTRAAQAGPLDLGEPGSDGQVAKIRQGAPDGWMFNGAAAGYDHAPLRARAGERVRIWAVAADPSSGTALHVVGAPFDTIYKEGAYLLRAGDPGGAQVLDLAPAQGGFAELVFPEAGRYPVVDHALRRAEAGAHGLFEVSAP
ncbi:FtsP/CotA-like multicopper oxidase with cupredoxin domain [Nonomuraea thailandensis]|uniref:FtsP/CotA-like multicopper oxidase with cupredoxin domain n=1 Tax=Nonomuraea thailandensis TaxID=1188745 RepID=A0A9X2K326_9ACTN|nr:cupredoxin domain-containing protein [Nonomuraea thailandensis]MCP2357924.1 FtsP/CotA-like multicopper oxidase with cupredoxin domain [Nonomuraea thailandensis]